MLIVEGYKQANKSHPNPEINTEKVLVSYILEGIKVPNRNGF